MTDVDEGAADEFSANEGSAVQSSSADGSPASGSAADRTATLRKLKLGDEVLAAHQTLESAASDVGRAAARLVGKIEELTIELDDLRERYRNDIRALETRMASEIAAAAQTREREGQELRMALARLEAEGRERESELQAECAGLKETLQKIYTTLS